MNLENFPGVNDKQMWIYKYGDARQCINDVQSTFVDKVVCFLG